MQVNHSPSRENIINDLFTDDMALFTGVQINKTSISDNDIIEVTTTYNMDTEEGKYNAALEDVCRSKVDAK